MCIYIYICIIHRLFNITMENHNCKWINHQTHHIYKRANFPWLCQITRGYINFKQTIGFSWKMRCSNWTQFPCPTFYQCTRQVTDPSHAQVQRCGAVGTAFEARSIGLETQGPRWTAIDPGQQLVRCFSNNWRNHTWSTNNIKDVFWKNNYDFTWPSPLRSVSVEPSFVKMNPKAEFVNGQFLGIQKHTMGVFMVHYKV